MKAGRTNARGQLVRLEDRMSKAQLERRAAKIEARKTVAQNLSLNIGHSKLMAMAVAAALSRANKIHYGIEAGLVALIAALFYLVLGR